MSVALVGHSLLSLQELKGYLNAGVGAQQDDNIKRAINAATGIIEQFLERRIVTRLSGGSPATITEYHSTDESTEIFLSEWPTIAITTAHESSSFPPVYDGTTLLSASQYESAPDRGLLRRVESGNPTFWACGNRAVRIVHTAGYQDVGGTATAAALIPDDIKQAAFFVAASIWKESERRGWGVSSVSDETGSVTRFMGYLPPSIKEVLAPHARQEFSRTWERP